MKSSLSLSPRQSKAALLIVCCFFVAAISYFRVFKNSEFATYDLRARLKRPQNVDSSIVLIEIGDDTLKSLGRWPIPRSFHAVMVDILREAGARQIVFDILFSETADGDEVFIQSVKRAGNVYLPVAFDIGDGNTLDEALQLAPITSGLKAAAAGFGHINVFVDFDGKIRSLPLFIRYSGQDVPSLAMDVASVEAGSVASYKDGKPFLVNYPGFWIETFQHFSYVEILKAYVARKNGFKSGMDLNVLRDKICFIGLTATGTADIRPNPIEKVYPMVGLQASVLNSFLTKNFIKDAGPLANSLINVFVFLVVIAVCFLFAPLRALLWSTAFASIYFIIACALFIFYGVWIDLYLPIFLIGVTYFVGLFNNFLKESRKRELLEKELEIAATIQRGFLPKEICSFRGIEVAVFLKPAKFVAGDFYDVVSLGDNIAGILIADVSGKGAPAALVMAQAISLFRIFAHRYSDPAEVLTQLNFQMASRLDSRFVTAQYIVIDYASRTICGACAGHAPLLFYSKARGKIHEVFPASGLPLGLDKNFCYESSQMPFGIGDRLFLYTDGWTEARNRTGEDFGLERLKEAILKNNIVSIEKTMKNLEERVTSFEENMQQHDDITAVMVEVL